MKEDAKKKKSETVALSDFVENPDNPREISEEDFQRLVEKIQRVPSGLTAMRIAYVTDHPAGKFVVLSGNTRLRVLKKLHGENGCVPAEWFQNITGLTSEQRREFIVVANKSDGKWDLDRLLNQYGRDELDEFGLADLISESKEVGEASGETESEPEEKVTTEKRVKDFVRAYWLISAPIDRSGDVVDVIAKLKERGIEVDEQLS